MVSCCKFLRYVFTKSYFYAMGVKFYNSLTTEHHQAKCTGDFRDLLTKYF